MFTLAAPAAGASLSGFRPLASSREDALADQAVLYSSPSRSAVHAPEVRCAIVGAADHGMAAVDRATIWPEIPA